jgi:hypothetical protein
VAADLQRVVARNQAALLRQQLGSARSATGAPPNTQPRTVTESRHVSGKRAEPPKPSPELARARKARTARKHCNSLEDVEVMEHGNRGRVRVSMPEWAAAGVASKNVDATFVRDLRQRTRHCWRHQSKLPPLSLPLPLPLPLGAYCRRTRGLTPRTFGSQVAVNASMAACLDCDPGLYSEAAQTRSGPPWGG